MQKTDSGTIEELRSKRKKEKKKQFSRNKASTKKKHYDFQTQQQKQDKSIVGSYYGQQILQEDSNCNTQQNSNPRSKLSTKGINYGYNGERAMPNQKIMVAI